MRKKTHKPVGIFGGTFDPIHHGHLRTALELYQRFDLQEVRLVPCQKPVLDKTAYATTEQRLQMLQLAIKDQPGLVIDEREIKRATPSFTIDTLISLRKEFPLTPLCLILGYDNLLNLERWHRWQELLKFAHLLINSRPLYEIPKQGVVAELLNNHQVIDAKLLQEQTAGLIYFAEMTQLNISATAIRQQIAQELSPRYLLPDAVWEFIQKEGIYKK
jgi:nicotinate-nucleotide adenylyltransferase